MDHERFLPQDVAVERVAVGETEFLGPAGQLDDPGSRRVGLEHHPKVHGCLPCPGQSFLGNPRSTVLVEGSGQRLVITFGRV